MESYWQLAGLTLWNLWASSLGTSQIVYVTIHGVLQICAQLQLTFSLWVWELSIVGHAWVDVCRASFGATKMFSSKHDYLGVVLRIIDISKTLCFKKVYDYFKKNTY